MHKTRRIIPLLFTAFTFTFTYFSIVALDACYTTAAWTPEERYDCPDECKKYGYDFQGNVADPNEKRHYVGCWNGATMGCVNCPKGLLFNQQWNACLYDGIHFTRPDPFKSGGNPYP